MAQPIEIRAELQRKGLTLPPINALSAGTDEYTVGLIQPSFNLHATEESIKVANGFEADLKNIEFFTLNLEQSTDLVITPEYSTSWRVISNLILNNILPEEGSLWILGCESITLADLENFVGEHQQIEWIKRDVQQQAGKSFLDPVLYVFKVKDSQDRLKNAIAVQFKAIPMSDRVYGLERDNLLRGNYRYIFNNESPSTHLTALVCSDTLEFNWREELPEITDRKYLIPHLQMNTEPFHPTFSRYRSDIYCWGGDYIEFITVNWARGFFIELDGNQIPSNYGGSAYYIKSDELFLRDERINSNHNLGMYYSYSGDHRFNIYGLSYDEGVFIFRTKKVQQVTLENNAIERVRSGPIMSKGFEWENGSWEEIEYMPDGREELLAEHQLEVLQNIEAIDLERFIAISTGEIKDDKSWHKVKELKSFHVNSNEVCNRLTIVNEPSESVRQNQNSTYAKLNHLYNNILTDTNNLPRPLSDLENGFILAYPVEDDYNYNIISDSNKPATVTYIGDSSEAQANKVFDKIYSKVKPENRKRVALWYMSGSGCKYKNRDEKDISKSRVEDPRDITKEAS